MVGVIAFGVFRPLSVQFSWLTANKHREQRVPEKKPGGGIAKALVPPQIPLRNLLTAAILAGIVTHFLAGIDTVYEKILKYVRTTRSTTDFQCGT